MLQFKQDDTEITLILTLTENVSIPNPYYLFVFTHVLTKSTVKFVKAAAEDESFYTERYNQFTIDPSAVFANAQPGEWHYTVYQQDNSLNVDINKTFGELETGKLMLERAVAFQFTKYESGTSFMTYNG